MEARENAGESPGEKYQGTLEAWPGRPSGDALGSSWGLPVPISQDMGPHILRYGDGSL